MSKVTTVVGPADGYSNGDTEGGTGAYIGDGFIPVNVRA
jgi:hypothetical protein